MIKVKVYISLIGQNHSTTITVNGIDKRITFSGAEGDINGTYTTGNIDEQKAIEDNSAFNKRYKLHKVYNDTPSLGVRNNAKYGIIGPGTSVGESLTAEHLIKNGIIEESGIPSPPNKIDNLVPEMNTDLNVVVFKTVNEAQAFLAQSPYNVPKSKIRTTADIITIGSEFNLNIEFRKE